MSFRVFPYVPVDPKPVLFWTGAGISMDPPSSLPSGYLLTKEIVEAYCLPNTWKTVTSLLRQAKITDSIGNTKAIPRLEAVLGNVVSILGYSALSRFSSLYRPTPNFLHNFFAEHIGFGGNHITLNLDSGIQTALKNLHPGCPYSEFTPVNMRNETNPNIVTPWIFHLHGKFGDKYSDLGLTFENIAKGFIDRVRYFIVGAILNAKTIIFAGYSGSDVFDVNPFFNGLFSQHSFTGKNVIWIDHTTGSFEVIPYSQSSRRFKIMDALCQCNATTYVCNGKTKYFFEELKNYWGFSAPDPPPYAPVPSFDKNISEWQKSLITAKLFVSMGIGNESLRSMGDQSSLVSIYSQYCMGNEELEEMTPINRILYIRHEALRELGLYKDASTTTARFIAQTDLDKMLIYERRASDAWLAGSWMRAKREFIQALTFGRFRLGKSHRFDTLYVETLRAYMQLCRDVGRIPVAGKYFVRENIFYPTSLIDGERQLQEMLQMDPYDKSHIARLFVWEGGASQRYKKKLPKFLLDDSTIIEVFGETDNVLGIINTTRSLLRFDLSKKKRIKKKNILKLLALSRAIGDRPGAVKACHLLAFTGNFSKRILLTFMETLANTQWNYPRKFYEIGRFCLFVCHGTLTRRST